MPDAVVSGEVRSSTDELNACLAAARQAQAASLLDEGQAQAQRAWDLARAQGHVAEQIEAGRLRAFFLYRRGALAALIRAGEAVLPLLRNQGASPELCELLRWMTLAGFETGDFDTAMRSANEGCAVAQELGDLRLIAMSLNALGATFERMGDPWQAERLMSEAAVLIRGQASPYEHVVTLNNLCGVALGAFYLLRDSGNDAACAEALAGALRYAQEVRPHALDFGDPFALVMTEGNLGEALLHAGRLEEAETLLEQTLDQARVRGYEAQGWRVRCSLAELALLRGRPEAAYDDLRLLLQEAGDRAPAATALRVHHALYRAAKQLGHHEQALRQFEIFQAIERRRAIAQLMAQSRFFVTRLEAEQARERAERQEARAAALEVHVEQDPLTGLGNRRCMESRMPALLREAEASGQALTLALIDADRFKDINDGHGHAVGDKVLQQLAQMLRDNTRGSDLLLRYGGEEFLVLFPDTVPDRAFEVCERLRHRVEAFPWQDLSPGLEVTLSIGLASTPPYATDLLIARADSAMYRAKHLGRNRVALA
ncbi:GGDEF domain-containing protein [Roseateles sp. DAIF2]|uniref:GGDEF domain-containing protein n=1 Tax=Roseateles sp. DAIF2 TaxID=2714952 RepID=UPI0018A28F77|nr:GGDEF domain-containing protein [Roseateles sp. DAIF2]QPF71710.1 GGDEF domain-containing protein [Roseateles sp. DAIF2]